MTEPKILYTGPLKDFSGYAHAARAYVRALDDVGCRIVTRSVKYDSGEYVQSEREKSLEDDNTQDINIVIQHTTPNETFKKDGVFNVIYFAWETDSVPQEWVEKINQMDLALVPCDENISAARKSGVTIPIVKVVHAFDKLKYQKKHEPFIVPGNSNAFKMLSICQFSKKKGVDALLNAYFSEFTSDDNVILILKSYINSGTRNKEQETQRLAQIIERTKKSTSLNNLPRVCLISDVMDEDSMGRLYNSSDCYVLPSRGEGFSITHFDAMGYGLPPIAVNWGGPTEFIDDDFGWLIDYNMSPVLDMNHPFDYLYTAKEKWAEPHIDSLMEAMREAYVLWQASQSVDDNSEWSNMVKLCKERVDDFSYHKVGNIMKDAIMKHYYSWKEANVRQSYISV